MWLKRGVPLDQAEGVRARSKGYPAWKHMVCYWRMHLRKAERLYGKRNRVEAMFLSMKSALGDLVRCRLIKTILTEFWSKIILYNALQVVWRALRI